MNWHVKEIEYSRSFTDALGSSWGYMSPGELADRYPNGGYRIVGDLKKHENPSGDLFLVQGETRVCIYPYQRKKTRALRTLGYIEVSAGGQPDCFVRVRGGNLFAGVILPVLAALLLAGLFLFGWLMTRKEEVPGLDQTAVSYHVEGMENTDPESISVPGVTVIEAEAGSARLDFPLVNPEGNTCYFAYTIRLEDTGEELYRSGLIEPGKAILEYDIARPLDAGTYDVLVQVETSDINDYTVQLNGAEIPATLKVQ